MTFPTERFAIGIDIGATKIASVIMSEQGDLVASSQTLTLANEGMEPVLDRIAGQIIDLMQRSPGPVAGVGIGSPGRVDSDCGIVYDAVNLGWKEVPLVEAISRRVGNDLLIWIQKDANLNALGEYYYGAGQGYDDFVYLGVGSGLGAGILSNGQLITGAGWYAADVGHLSIDPDGPACLCGGRGCAELVASGPGLVRVAQHMLASASTKSVLVNFPALTTTDVLRAAQQDDALALEALREVGRALGIIMSACTVILNPRRFVIGGGLGLAGFDHILPTAREELMRRTLPNHRGAMDIVPSRVESPAIGSACLVWYELS